MSKKKLKNNSGFTLVEMMVSVAVIVIVSAMSLVSFRSTNNSASSSMAAQKLASDIRMTQGWALSLKDFNGASPEGGWGIYFSKTGGDEYKYSFFADKSDNHVCAANCGNTTEKYKDVAFLNNIKIIDIKINSVSVNRLHLTFIPPEPEICICENQGDCNSGCSNTNSSVEIELDGGNKIIVNKYGMVDVD